MSFLQRFRRRSFGSLRADGAILCGVVFCYSASAVGQIATTTTLTVTSGGNAVTSIAAQTVLTLTATVMAGGAAAMPGQVEFCDVALPNCTGIHLAGLAQVTKAGTAVMKFVPGPGVHPFQAFFLGTNSKLASSSAVSTVTVGIPDPTSITSGGGPGNYSLGASVAGYGTAFPTGTVSFIDTSNANYVLATGTLTKGSGTFGGQELITAGTTQPLNQLCSCAIGVAAADFNGDGKLDIVVGYNAVDIFFGSGNATFTYSPNIPIAGVWGSSFAVGDFNQDGKMDFIMTQTPSAPNFSLVYTYVMLGNGDGTFNDGPVMPGVGNPFVATADFNGDGIPDIVLSAGGPTEALGATIMLGNGDGTFTTKASYTTGNTGPAVIGDFNGDGKVDLALVGAGGQYVLYLGNGDGTFTPSAQAPPAGLTAPEVTGDFAGEGTEGIVTATFNPTSAAPPNFGSTSANILRIVPPMETSFTPNIPGIFIVGTGPHLIAAVYGGDGNYLPSMSSTIALTALPEPTTLSLTANPASFNQFQPAVLTATLTPDMAQNHNATGTVTFMSGTTVVGTATVTNGVATLSTTKFPSGNGNVIATYPGDTNFAASTSSAVSVVVAPVDFSMALASASLTIETQHHLTTSVTLTSINGFTDSITVACSKPPKNITCQFTPSPAMLAGNGTATVSFYLDTDSIEGFARNTAPLSPRGPVAPIALAFSFLVGVAGLGRRGIRTRLMVVLLAAIAISAALGLSGCGEIIIPPPSVLPGTYTIPVTATAAATGVVHTANLTLTVTR